MNIIIKKDVDLEEILTCRPGGVIRCDGGISNNINKESDTIGMFPNVETGVDNQMLGMSIIAGMLDE